MSKFLLNLFLQISKALVYSKIKLLFGKEFFHTFNPIGPAASRPIWHFGPAAAHFFSFQQVVPPPSPHWASASRPAQLALMAQPVVFFLLPHRSQAQKPPPLADLMPHGRPIYFVEIELHDRSKRCTNIC
jgi:hypothetical protein